MGTFPWLAQGPTKRRMEKTAVLNIFLMGLFFCPAQIFTSKREVWVEIKAVHGTLVL